MKNTLGFWGIVVLLICTFSNGSSATEGCGNMTENCKHFCDLCDEVLDVRNLCYEQLIKITCFEAFVKSMSTLNPQEFCQWNTVKSAYDNFTTCTEERADCLLIPWPNKLVEGIFVEIHSKYFRSCPMQGLDDPPPSIVFALVMTPICLIPVMVVLVVMKTKNGDRRS